MQQLSRVCLLPEHKSQAIDYVCLFSKCKNHRMLCKECLSDGSHNHDDNKNVFDAKEFYHKIQSDIKEVQMRQVTNYNIAKSVNPLKHIIQEIQKQLKVICNIVQYIEAGKLLTQDYKYLENQMENIKRNGFQQIDDAQLDILIHLDKQLQISDLNIYKQFEEQSKLIMEQAQKVQEWRLQPIVEDLEFREKLINTKYNIHSPHECYICNNGDNYDEERGIYRECQKRIIYSSTISNDLKYIVTGQENGIVKVWNYQTNGLNTAINYNKPILRLQFSKDSQYLFVAAQLLHQLDANDKFEEVSKTLIHDDNILNIHPISNTIVLTSSDDGIIIKTDVHDKQQLLKIQAHGSSIYALDYHHTRDVIASASRDESIKLWNGSNGALIVNQQKAHYNGQNIIQIFFLINTNQLVSVADNVIIWNISYSAKYLTQAYQIGSEVSNIVLGIDQQYIALVKNQFIEIYTIKGEFLSKKTHSLDNTPFNAVQHESLKAIMVLGILDLYVLETEFE